MMDVQLTVEKLLNRAVTLYPSKEIVTVKQDDGTHRYTYADAYERICQLAHALDDLGVRGDARVATVAPNNFRHYELYYGPACSGRSLHMVNHRLPDEHLRYLLNDAQDRVVFIDPKLLEVIEPLADEFETVEQYVVLGGEIPETSLEPVIGYEDLLEGQPTTYDWPDLDEDRECGICYTSGTTGKPKGVQYTHRGVYLHSMMMGHSDTHRISEHDTVLPVVPMFHANGWGLPYSATFAGSTIVLPNQQTQPETIARVIEEEQVTYAAAVPTLWIGVIEGLDEEFDHDISCIDRLVVGGSAPSKSLLQRYEEQFDVPILQGWGMTEMSPVGTVSTLTSETAALSKEEQYTQRAKAGIPVPGVSACVRDQNGEEIERDGEMFGELEVRGPWVTDGYHNRPDATEEALTDDGWLKTGDIATWDEYGYIDIVDRKDDAIKSGGEWISSLELENELMSHESVREAAVIGIPHEKWQERPLAIVNTSGEVDAETLRDHLAERFPRWWLPDSIVFVDEVPKTSTGKFDKSTLREQYEDQSVLEDTPSR
ncbi:MAG: fatty-acyl-CoA synthase [Natrialbaceae archaeon]|jgi:fatty-acyl-CoA synthase